MISDNLDKLVARVLDKVCRQRGDGGWTMDWKIRDGDMPRLVGEIAAEIRAEVCGAPEREQTNADRDVREPEPLSKRLKPLTPGMFGRPTGVLVMQRNGSDVQVLFRHLDGKIYRLNLGAVAKQIVPDWKHGQEQESICQLEEMTSPNWSKEDA
jgi:hypothetical protein